MTQRVPGALGLTLVLSLLGSAARAQLTLDEAWRLAETNHPQLRASKAEVAAAQAEARESQALLWNNPQVTAEGRQRRLGQAGEPDVSRRDAAMGLSQTFETGGQPQARREGAQASLEASQAGVEATRREVRAEVADRFVQVAALQQRVKLEQEGLALLEKASAIVAKRVQAGEDGRLDGNLAAVEAERSANQLSLSKEQLLQSRYALATSLHMSPGSAPEVMEPSPQSQASYTQEELLAVSARQPRVLAAVAKERAAGSRVALEKGARSPDVTVGLAHSVERGIEARDRITTLSISMPLPLFRRNEAAIGRALSEAEHSRIERESALRDSASAVRMAWSRQESLRARVARLRDAVMPKLDENQRLSFKALQVGEISLGQYLLARRQTLDAQRDLLDAATELARVRFELEAAAGWPERLPPLDARENNKR